MQHLSVGDEQLVGAEGAIQRPSAVARCRSPARPEGSLRRLVAVWLGGQRPDTVSTVLTRLQRSQKLSQNRAPPREVATHSVSLHVIQKLVKSVRKCPYTDPHRPVRCRDHPLQAFPRRPSLAKLWDWSARPAPLCTPTVRPPQSVLSTAPLNCTSFRAVTCPAPESPGNGRK